MINEPGSGGYNLPRRGGGYFIGLPGFGPPRLGNFVGGDTIAGTGKLGRPAIEGIVQNLETDLSNDHPVSMQFAGGGLTGANGAWNGTSIDPGFAGSSQHPGQANGVTVKFSAALASPTSPFRTERDRRALCRVWLLP